MAKALSAAVRQEERMLSTRSSDRYNMQRGRRSSYLDRDGEDYEMD